MKTIYPATVLLIASLFVRTPTASAQEDAAAADAAPKPLAVSVLPFVVPEHSDIDGGQVSEIVALLLSAEPGFRVVDRQTLDQVLDEQALSATGLVQTNEAVKVGRLVGARLIVVGRSFELGDSRVMTAKIIGTETTLLEGVVERGTLDTPADAMLLSLSEKVVQTLRERGASLVARDEPTDRAPALAAELAGRSLPTFAVLVTEDEMAAPRQPEVPDPAVESEIKALLLSAGAVVKDIPANDLADWAQDEGWNDARGWPRSLEDVDLVITGKAFSERGGQLGQLHVFGARSEINMISRETGNIVLVDAQTTRGVDLSPSLAGKNALQEAGRLSGIKVLEYLVENTRPRVQGDEAQQ